MALAVGPARRQQFIQADVDHDSGHAAEEHTHDLGRDGAGITTHKKPQPNVGDDGANRFGQTAE